MKNNHSICFLLGLALFFICCGNDDSSDFSILQTASEFDFHAIELYDGRLYATGGDVWHKSDLVTSSDGISWVVDSLTDKSIFDLHSDDEFLYAVGNNGYIFKGSPELELSRTEHWGILRGFTHTQYGYLAVGGKNFNSGWIYQVTPEIRIDTVHNYGHQFSEVWADQEGNCVAIGYGIIVTSADYGSSWSQSVETGDFYISIASNSIGIPYIVGNNGSLLFSNDKGVTWIKYENGHSPIGVNNHFRKIKFYASFGFITGEDGLLWTSDDNGRSWSDISLDTKLDLIDFVKWNDSLIIVSESGKIISIDLK